jgi:hypothetical protein
MSTRENSWSVHQSYLAIPLRQSSSSKQEARAKGMINLALQSTWRKILPYGTSGFTSPTKEGVLRIFIALKNPSPRPGLNPQTLGLTASTVTRPKGRGFKPGQGDAFLKAIKIRSTPSFGWEVKPKATRGKILRHVKDLLKSHEDG